MKKFSKFFTVGIPVFLTLSVMLLGFSTKTKAVQYQAVSFFIGNAQGLALSNSITLTNNGNQSTNYVYIGGQQMTNVLAGFTNNIGVTNPGIFASAVKAWSDSVGQTPSLVFYFTLNNTNVYVPSEDNNLSIPPYTNLPVLNITPNAASTNSATFIIQRGSGPRYAIQWELTNNFTCLLSNIGVGPGTMVTNLPTAFTQGAGWFRIFSVVSGAGTGAGLIISSAGIAGFAP